MVESRRHSLDAPLAKRFMALRRVRSLRNPDTTYMESGIWETNSRCDPILNLGGSKLREYDFRSDKDPGSLSDEEEEEHSMSLNQKYRPRTFDELVGQPALVQSLRNSIAERKISPICLFHGPPGTGKTSAARIFASALNCSSVELDSSQINSKEKLRNLIRKSRPASIFIVEDCENLSPGAWTAILSASTELRRVVFILLTSEFEKLSRVSPSSCQKYHFQKIKDYDVVRKLEMICQMECLDYEGDALAFVARRSGGSLREAETMLDQISLLGKKITLSLAHELSGVVPETELLGLLDAALSSDVANIVGKAREMMSSKVEPMQLTSQLANLIMDILSGRCEITAANVGLQKLRNALKVLSETEKRLRSSKSRDAWLTVALLQLNIGDSANYYASDTNRDQERDILEEVLLDSEKLGVIWRKTIERCSPDLPKSLFKGRLTSVRLKHGLAMVHAEYSSAELVSAAESSRAIIEDALETVLCRHVELQLGLISCSSLSRVRALAQKLFRWKSTERPKKSEKSTPASVDGLHRGKGQYRSKCE